MYILCGWVGLRMFEQSIIFVVSGKVSVVKSRTKTYTKRYPTFEKTVSKRKIIGIHFLTFIVLTIIWFFSTEPFLKKFAPGIHSVEMWFNLIVFGTIGILI